MEPAYSTVTLTLAKALSDCEFGDNARGTLMVSPLRISKSDNKSIRPLGSVETIGINLKKYYSIKKGDIVVVLTTIDNKHYWQELQEFSPV